jgi:hypothetical protein
MVLKYSYKVAPPGDDLLVFHLSCIAAEGVNKTIHRAQRSRLSPELVQTVNDTNPLIAALRPAATGDAKSNTDIHQQAGPRGATVARSTPDRKVIRSNRVGVNDLVNYQFKIVGPHFWRLEMG